MSVTGCPNNCMKVHANDLGIAGAIEPQLVPEKDFSRSRKVSFYDLMWFLLFIEANSMNKEIGRTFNYKKFSYISEAAILKSRSKIKVSAFEQLFHKFNDSLENPKR